MNDGGPAFPRPSGEAVDTAGQHFWPAAQSGMSLRDYFAAAALTGLFVQRGMTQPTPFTDTQAKCASIAEVAYRIADAMLAARESLVSPACGES